MNVVMGFALAQRGDTRVRFDKLEILGSVIEGDARHVLTRMTVGAGDLAITEFEILSCLPYKDGWRLQLNGNMKGLANVLRSKIGAK